MADLLKELYFSSLDKKLEIAHHLSRKFDKKLHNSRKLQGNLKKLASLSGDLDKIMSSLSMPGICADCGVKPEGGCCSSYMANETDSVQLLMNILLDIIPAPQRDDSFECRYLGSKGCILRIKPIFCLNYNCHQVLDGSTKNELKLLEKSTGNLLGQQLEVEKIILSLICYQ